MRKAMFAAFALMLVACTSSTGEASKVVDLVKQHCGLAVNVADVAAALAAPNAAVTGAIAMAREICKQAQATGETGAMEPWEQLLVPVHYELAQADQPEPSPLPDPAPPETVVPKPEQEPKDEDKPNGDDCVAVINGVCIRKEKE